MRKRFYDDPKENAAFERCVDVMTSLIKKYGPALSWNQFSGKFGWMSYL